MYSKDYFWQFANNPFKIDAVDGSSVAPGHGEIINTCSTTRLVLDADGVHQSVSANNLAFLGSRYISPDVWSRYDLSGILLASAKGMVSEPAAQQLVAYPEDASQWGEAGTCDVNPSGTIAGRAAFQLTGQTATWHRRRFFPITALTGDYVFLIHVASDNQDIARVTIEDTTNTVNTIFDLNGSDGSTNIITPAAGAVTISPITLSDGYLFPIVFTPLTDGNNFNVGVGTGTTNAADTIRVALANVVAGSIATSPIPTQSTRAVSTDTIPIENFPHRKGYVKVEWTPLFDYDVLPVDTYNKGIITPTSTAVESTVRYYRTGSGDGTLSIRDSNGNEKFVLVSWPKDTTHTIVASWDLDQQLMGICVDGTDSGNGTFAGWTLADVVTFGMSTIGPQSVKMAEMAGRFLTPAQRIAMSS